MSDAPEVTPIPAVLFAVIPAPPLSLPWWRRYLWHLVPLLIGALLTLGAVLYMQGPPTTFVSVAELDGVAVNGGRLEMLFEVRRARLCPVLVERQLWQWRVLGDGSRLQYIVPLPMLGVANSLPDQARSIVSLPMPMGLTPGRWFYTSRSYSQCSPWAAPFGSTPTKSPDVPVDVIP